MWNSNKFLGMGRTQQFDIEDLVTLCTLLVPRPIALDQPLEGRRAKFRSGEACRPPSQGTNEHPQLANRLIHKGAYDSNVVMGAPLSD